MPGSTQLIFDTALAAIPEPLRRQVLVFWQELAPHVTALPPDKWLESLPRVFAASEFVARSCVQHPSLISDLVLSGDLFRVYSPGDVTARTLIDVQDEPALKSQLRRLRQREMVRLAWRDLAGWSDLNEVMTSLSEFADAMIDTTLKHIFAWAQAKYGVPRDVAGQQPVTPVVLGLGKLGGQELNFSSDVDLMFVYSDEGETQGARSMSNHEFFVRLGQSLVGVLSEATHEGFVFRIDLRLRPHGASGPVALSFDAMEQYYQSHGREWERYALIKARVVAGARDAGDSLLASLKPFVFRKYLDYGALEAIRTMKVMIEREVNRKGTPSNIKLGLGGIREIEFIAQALQLIRGGRETLLQSRRLLQVLPLLQQAGHITGQALEELTAAYVFLRNTEHRLQMVADRQTHVLPTEPVEQARLAFAMGFPDWPAYEAVLDHHRGKVHEHFSVMFALPQGEAPSEDGAGLSGVWLNTVDTETAQRLLRETGFSDPEAAMALLAGLREGSDYRTLSIEGRTRMDRLIPLLLGATGLSTDPVGTLVRLVKLIEAIGRRSTYLALLIENPMALAQLVKLCAASPWIANWIAQHPIILDELLDPRSLYAPFVHAALADELRQLLAHIPDDDLETQMDTLREFRHGHVLRVAAADIVRGEGSTGKSDADMRSDPEQVGASLACIADVVITESLALAQKMLIEKHGAPSCANGAMPGFAVIGYGKLGSLELGYASDLDIIFLYEACVGEGKTTGARAVSNEEFFARTGQRLIHFLTTRTPAGILYEVDMRLRPSGNAGPLVTSLPALRDYQKQHAWTWEHQALVRARAIAGSPALCQAFADVRHEILCLPRDLEKLKTDVREMREKMAATHTPKRANEFHLKHSRGGIVDIEFMVQYWVLRWAYGHPALTRYTDNIHIMEALAAEQQLDCERVRRLSEAYRFYLSMEQRLKLMEHEPVVVRTALGNLPDEVTQIWRETFLLGE